MVGRRFSVAMAACVGAIERTRTANGAIVKIESIARDMPPGSAGIMELPAQRVGSGVTLTSMFGRRFSVSTVSFEMRLFTFSGSA